MFGPDFLDNAQAHLATDAGAVGVALDEDQCAQLLKYCAVVETWNRSFNLVSRQDTSRLLSRHVLDSLSAGPFVSGESVLDIGSGAGFPGVPLAIAYPQRQFVLNDRSTRKSRFLAEVQRQLQLSNVEVWTQNLKPGAAHPQHAQGFSTVVSRAAASVAKSWQIAQTLLQPGGVLVVLSATLAPGQAPPAPETITGASTRSETLTLPGIEGQHVITIVTAAANT